VFTAHVFAAELRKYCPAALGDVVIPVPPFAIATTPVTFPASVAVAALVAVIVPVPVGARVDPLPTTRDWPLLMPDVIALKLRLEVVVSAVHVSVPSTAMPLK
jgi:hypothetical protein